MTRKTQLNAYSKFVHAGTDHDPYTGGSSIPIYQASTFAQRDPARPGQYEYTRSANPTRDALESAIADMEHGTRGLAFSSGMAAITSALLLFKPGDHVVAPEDVYGGTYRILTTLLAQWKLESTFVDMTNPKVVVAAVQPNTRALFIETPSNPLLKITSMAEMVKIARARKLLTIIDNTFMTPWLQQPLDHGIDIVLHSATKFLGGHSDVLAGLVVTNDEALGHRLKTIQNTIGAVLAPHDSWLVLRGMKTLTVRMEQQQDTAGQIAERMSSWSSVRRIHYPALPGHPGRDIHMEQSSGGGAVISFELVDGAAARRALQRVKLAMPAVSLGGVETILSHPATMSHAAMPANARRARGITDGLLRLSVGLESAGDLLADLWQAIEKSGKMQERNTKQQTATTRL